LGGEPGFTRVGVVVSSGELDEVAQQLTPLRWFSNLLQDLGTGVQDFPSNCVKASPITKFIFAVRRKCLDSKECSADVAKWQTQRT